MIQPWYCWWSRWKTSPASEAVPHLMFIGKAGLLIWTVFYPYSRSCFLPLVKRNWCREAATNHRSASRLNFVWRKLWEQAIQFALCLNILLLLPTPFTKNFSSPFRRWATSVSIRCSLWFVNNSYLNIPSQRPKLPSHLCSESWGPCWASASRASGSCVSRKASSRSLRSCSIIANLKTKQTHFIDQFLNSLNSFGL